jgi:non-ribosomal peptide synthetase component E (peptide arylation enzyme)
MDQRVEWLIDAIAQRDPERVALIHGPRRWTYGQLREESLRRAGVLVEAGCAPATWVITALPVTDDLVIAFPRLLSGWWVYSPPSRRCSTRPNCAT